MLAPRLLTTGCWLLQALRISGKLTRSGASKYGNAMQKEAGQRIHISQPETCRSSTCRPPSPLQGDGSEWLQKQSRPLNSILRTIQSAEYFLHPLPSSPLRPNYRHLRLYIITSNRPSPKGLFLSLFLVIPAIPFSKEFHPQGYHRTRSNPSTIV